MITIATHAASRSSETSETSAAVTEQLVGERVHELAEVRDAALPAGDPAVERVRDRRDAEHHGRVDVAVGQLGQQQGGEHRDQQDPQHRQDVRHVELEHDARL
jgi:hypothetical protein